MKLDSRSAGMIFGAGLLVLLAAFFALAVANMTDSQYEEWGEEMVSTNPLDMTMTEQEAEAAARAIAEQMSEAERDSWLDWLRSWWD